MSDLVPYYKRFIEDSRDDYMPINSGFSFNPLPSLKPETNEWDFEIAKSSNSTNIELANIFERVNRENKKVEKIQASIHAFIKNMETTPGATRRKMVVRGEEEQFLFWRRNPVLFEIEITNEF